MRPREPRTCTQDEPILVKKKTSADSLILVIPVSPYLQNNATEPQDMISSDDNDLITCNFENDTSELHISSCYLHKHNKDSKKNAI